MPMKIEMHTHTSQTSPCAHISAAEAVQLYKKAGYDGMVITDHYNKWVFDQNNLTTHEEITEYFLEGYRQAKKAAGDDILILFGAEINLTESPNDYLLYGASEDFFYKNPMLHTKSLPELYELCHKNNILLIQAHPNRAYCAPASSEFLDGAEVFNGNPRHNSNNPKTFKWAKEDNLIMTSGSDFHETEDVAKGGIHIEETISDIHGLTNILKSGTYKLIINGGIYALEESNKNII